MRFGLVLCLILMGCGKQAQVATVAPPPAPEQKNPAHRFEITSYMPKDVAFDTMTGQYCKTWTGATYDNMPFCTDVYNNSQIAGLPAGLTLRPITPATP